MRIEVFVTGCPLCRQLLTTVREAAPPDAEIVERPCEGDACCHAGERYGVHSVVPALAVDGKVVHQGRLTPADAARLVGGGHA